MSIEIIPQVLESQSAQCCGLESENIPGKSQIRSDRGGQRP